MSFGAADWTKHRHACGRLPDVLAVHRETVRVLHTLTPIIVVMAGKNEVDPYKD